MNSNFTVYEMVVKYAFLAMSLVRPRHPEPRRAVPPSSCPLTRVLHGGAVQVVSLVYFCKLTRVPAQRWSYEQKWIGGILIGLMFFNNPLLAMEIYKCVARAGAACVVGEPCLAAANSRCDTPASPVQA